MSARDERIRASVGHGPWILASLTALVWMAQGSASWYVVGHACPSGERQWSLGVARGIVLALTVVALAIAITAIARAVRTLRATAPLPEGKQFPTLAETMAEQKRFTAMMALLAGATLTLGIVFAGLSALVIRVCGEMR
ncbi:MAG TPA: hypothetical protein VN962_01935 [Polyangia bacterium]|nr:hypothetical protein [Polyangia bacterium]